MNDQIFVNEYIRLLNETLNDAFNKNIVMQAQLAVAKKQGDHTAELETKIKELTAVSSDNNALHSQLNALKNQLDHANNQLNSKNSHVETFKRELVEARNAFKNAQTDHAREIGTLNAEIELLKKQIEELTSKKKKKEKALNTVILEDNLISVSDTF